jgi:hypothetical protein
VLRVNLRGVRDEPARDREHGPGIAKRHRPHGHPRGRDDEMLMVTVGAVLGFLVESCK